jgi:hypothetical protein
LTDELIREALRRAKKSNQVAVEEQTTVEEE